MSTRSPTKTALITGASSGLGAEYARQLAAMGYDLILTARRAERLQQLADLLQSKYGTIPWFCRLIYRILSDVENLISTINNLDTLDLLVNNAGFGTVGRFHHVDPSKELSMLNVHMVAPVMLCRAALACDDLPKSRARSSMLHRWQVLYPSVMSCITPPKLSWSASRKHCILNSMGLQVHIQVLCPGFILTEFHDTIEYARFSRRGIPKFLWMTAWSRSFRYH